MTDLFLKMFCTVAASFLLASNAYSENNITVNAVGVPYMRTVYAALAGDFTAVEKRFVLNYAGGKSEEFATKISSGMADFSISDIPLSRKELDERKLIQVPAMVTAIVPVVNLPGVETDKLVLTGALLASIMSGDITVWNHESIRALNPSLALPAIRIKPMARSDTSGATLALTSYLAKSSAQFNSNTGSGVLVKWSNAVQLLHSGEALEAVLHETPGAITYIEMDVGNTKRLSFVKLKHHTGSIVKADLGFLRSGIVSARVAGQNDGSGTLAATDLGQNWPIILPIYIVLPQKSVDDAKMAAALRLIYWTFFKGDDTIENYGLVPLSPYLQTQAVKLFRKIQAVNGTPLIVNYSL